MYQVCFDNKYPKQHNLCKSQSLLTSPATNQPPVPPHTRKPLIGANVTRIDTAIDKSQLVDPETDAATCTEAIVGPFFTTLLCI